MSIGKQNTYGQKWGTNYPWQKAMLQSKSGGVQVASFIGDGINAGYTIPVLSGKTISLVVNKTNQVVVAPGDYSLVGDVLTFTFVPVLADEYVILYS